VTLSVSGLPSGVTTTITPFEASDSGTLGMVNYFASSTAAAGTVTVTLTATSVGGFVHTTTVSLTVASGKDLTPPSVPANPVWSADGMTVTLSWQPSTDDVGVVGYDLYYGSFFLGTFTDPQLALIGFKSGTQYVFTVKARDAAGNVSAASSPMTVLLSAPKDTTPPTAPTKVAATSVTSTRISLSWTASTDDVGVVVYQVYVNGALSGTVTSPSATLTGLTPSTSYSVTVTALDAAGNVSQASTALTVKTTAS
jgi:chitinase